MNISFNLRTCPLLQCEQLGRYMPLYSDSLCLRPLDCWDHYCLTIFSFIWLKSLRVLAIKFPRIPSRPGCGLYMRHNEYSLLPSLHTLKLCDVFTHRKLCISLFVYIYGVYSPEKQRATPKELNQILSYYQILKKSFLQEFCQL